MKKLVQFLIGTLAFLQVNSIVIAGTVHAPNEFATPSEVEIASYFDQVVNQTENGDIVFFPRRWFDDIHIVVHGDPGAKVLEELTRIVSELNTLIAPLQIQIVEANGNADLFFAPVSEFRKVLPEYRAYNPGYHWVTWDDAGAIQSATVLVSTTQLSQSERLHILREELTQSLGFLSDSASRPDSIFYRGWSTTTEFSPLDRAVIQRLYSDSSIPATEQAQTSTQTQLEHQD